MADIYVKTTGNDTTGDGSDSTPYATPGKAASVASSGDRILLQSGTYTLSTTTPGAGGPVDLPSGVFIEGYNATAGDMGTAPVIDAGTNGSIVIVKFTGDPSIRERAINVAVDGNGQTSVVGFRDDTSFGSNVCYLCTATDCTTGFSSSAALATLVCVACDTYGCTTGFNGPRSASFCAAHGGTTGWYMAATTQVCTACLADSCSGDGFTGDSGGDTTAYVMCVAYGCGSDGFAPFYSGCTLVGCISYGNTGYAFNIPANTPAMIHCAGDAGGSGLRSNTPLLDIGTTTLTADPFVNAAADDFNLNETSGGGAALRAVNFNLAMATDTDVYPFAVWAVPAAGGGGGTTGRQGLHAIESGAV